MGSRWCPGKRLFLKQKPLWRENPWAVSVLVSVVPPALTQGLAYGGYPRVSVIETGKSRFKFLPHLPLVVQSCLRDESPLRASFPVAPEWWEDKLMCQRLGKYNASSSRS